MTRRRSSWERQAALRDALSVIRQLLPEVPGPAAWVSEKWFLRQGRAAALLSPREIDAARRLLGIERRQWGGVWWWLITEIDKKAAAEHLARTAGRATAEAVHAD